MFASLLGALPQNLMSSLSPEQKSGITKEAMSIIPPSTIANVSPGY